MTGAATCAVDTALRHRAVTDSYEYDAFGNQITHTGATPNNYLYRGEQWDPDLGLYYLRARYYNPLTGRFMSRDPNNPGPRDGNGTPVDPKELHKYLYAGGDPIDAFDPTGRVEMTKPTGTVGEAVGEYVGLIQNIAFKVGFYINYAIPAYLATPQGKTVVVKALALLGAGEVIVCEAEELYQSLNPNSTSTINCSYFDTSNGQ